MKSNRSRNFGHPIGQSGIKSQLYSHNEEFSEEDLLGQKANQSDKNECTVESPENNFVFVHRKKFPFHHEALLVKRTTHMKKKSLR